MAKYQDAQGNVTEVGNPDLNPTLIAGKTAVPDTTPLGSSITSSSLVNQPPISYNQPASIPPVTLPTLPTTATLSPTQQNVSGGIKDLTALNTEIANKPAYTTEQQNAAGIPAASKLVTDLTAELVARHNEANAIPLKAQQASEGRGITVAGLAPIESAATRNNAIKTLETSSVLAAAQGNLANAMDIADRAVQAKFAPLEAKAAAIKANLDLIINSPEYTAEEKARAATQLAAQQKQAEELASSKADAQGASDAVIKLISVNPNLDALTVAALRAAKTPVEVATIASTLGLQTNIAGRYKDIPGKTVTNLDGSQYTTPTQVFDTIAGKIVNTGGKTSADLNAGGGTATPTGPTPGTVSTTPGVTGAVGSGKLGLPFAQYGLLANTDLNPTNIIDKAAQSYIDAYLKSGGYPSSATFARGAKAGFVNDAKARAEELYYQATGESLPNPQQLKEYNKEIASNLSVINKNVIQADTINKNFNLAIQGEITDNVNKNATIINKILNPIYLALGDPATNQAMVSNGTISQEFANLISIRNSSGTMAADKLMADELIKFGTSVEAQKAVVERLQAEATNIHSALVDRNTELYKITDPLMKTSANPGRKAVIDHSFVENSLQNLIKTDPAYAGKNYDSIIAEMNQHLASYPGTQPALDKATGKPVFATPAEIMTGKFVAL